MIQYNPIPNLFPLIYAKSYSENRLDAIDVGSMYLYEHYGPSWIRNHNSHLGHWPLLSLWPLNEEHVHDKGTSAPMLLEMLVS